MSTFYLLPPRSIVAERFSAYLKDMVPSADWSPAGLADTLEGLLLAHDDVYVVWREDLPSGVDAMSALIHAYGAEAGDEVIEVRVVGLSGAWTSLRWPVPAAA